MNSTKYWRLLDAFSDIVRHSTLRPRMYTGLDDFDALANFLDTYDSGIAFGNGRRGLHLPEMFMGDYYEWLVPRFDPNIDCKTWSDIVKKAASGAGSDPFTVLRETFQHFAGDCMPPLVQLAQQAE